MVLGAWRFLLMEVAGLDGVFITSFFSYLCFGFIVVDLVCDLFVFCVIVMTGSRKLEISTATCGNTGTNSFSW